MWKLFKFLFLILVILLTILIVYSLIFDINPVTEMSIIQVPIEYD